MVRIIDSPKSQDVIEVSPRTAQSQVTSSGDEESNQSSGITSKRAIVVPKTARYNAIGRFHRGIWTEPSVILSNMDCRPTDEQLFLADNIGWGDSPVSHQVEKKMFRLLPKVVTETERTEVKEKRTIGKRKAMCVPKPDSTNETPENTDRRSKRARKRVTTYNDRTLVRKGMCFENRYQSDSDASENTALQQIMPPEKPQKAVEDPVTSPDGSESELSNREPGTADRRSRRARTMVRTYNTKILAGIAVHTPVKYTRNQDTL
ncbi:hypothetical protein EAE96_007753 [Botrytis aclada]|nr:hypothetical protein EAE96_007753 [Botrytis aclada]